MEQNAFIYFYMIYIDCDVKINLLKLYLLLNIFTVVVFYILIATIVIYAISIAYIVFRHNGGHY